MLVTDTANRKARILLRNANLIDSILRFKDVAVQ